MNLKFDNIKFKVILYPSYSRILAAISGLMLVAAVPPINLYVLGWVGLIPLFMALEKSSRSGFSEGFIAGLTFNTGTVYWLALNTGTYKMVATATMLATVMILATGWGVAALLFQMIYRTNRVLAWFSIPFSWITFEGWLSHLVDVGFPWPLLALTQAEFDPALQLMEYTGVWGTSFWVVVLNLILFLGWRSNNLKKRIVLIALIIWISIPYISLKRAYRYYNTDFPVINVSCAQGNIDPLDKWQSDPIVSWNIYDSLSRTGSYAGLDLLIWPETALPMNLPLLSHYTKLITDLSIDLDCSIITGASARQKYKGVTRPLNSAYLITPDDGVVDRGSKIFLVPFGERVPFQAVFPALGNLNFGQAEFLPDLQRNIFEIKTNTGVCRFPVLICYESGFSGIVRSAVLKGSNFLVTISNDGWYGKSSEPYQIAVLSRFRCIETRRSMARAANTGISLIADPLGRIISSTDLETRGNNKATVPLVSDITFFVKHGNWFLVVITLIYGLCLTYVLYRKF